MKDMNGSPLVGVICCSMQLDAPHHVVFERYVDELADSYGVTPVLIPAFREDISGPLEAHIDRLVRRLDGFLLPGSTSNVHPACYGEDVRPDVLQHFDRRRDHTSLTLIRRAVDQRKPILGICRGMQEINVALGGSLRHVSGHRNTADRALAATLYTTQQVVCAEPLADSFSARYLPSHEIIVSGDGLLRELCRRRGLAIRGNQVNSLHGQCVDRPGPGVQVDAVAPDGVIEAISFSSASQFCLGVQWHPEWLGASGSLSRLILEAFVQACYGSQTGLSAGSS